MVVFVDCFGSHQVPATDLLLANCSTKHGFRVIPDITRVLVRKVSAIKGAMTERPVDPDETSLGEDQLPIIPHDSCHRYHMERCAMSKHCGWKNQHLSQQEALTSRSTRWRGLPYASASSAILSTGTLTDLRILFHLLSIPAKFHPRFWRSPRTPNRNNSDPGSQAFHDSMKR